MCMLFLEVIHVDCSFCSPEGFCEHLYTFCLHKKRENIVLVITANHTLQRKIIVLVVMANHTLQRKIIVLVITANHTLQRKIVLVITANHTLHRP